MCATLALGVAPAAASAPGAEGHASLESTVRYMQELQDSDGGFGEHGESSLDFSAWVALALAAVGINPQDQARPGGVSVYTYLSEHAGEPSAEAERTTTLERELLVVDAAGTSPHNLGGVDLVRQILERKRPDGSFAHEAGGAGTINDTIFAILSLSLVPEPAAGEAVQQAAGWLIAQQEPDHGWPLACPRSQPACEPESNVEMTGAALEALRAAGDHGTPAQRAALEPARSSALEYLKEAQDADGGFAELPGAAESNVDSTAWVVQGIWAAGQNPKTWTREGTSPNPLAYMESLQQPNGSIRWKASKDSYPLFNTAYVTPALAGRWLPILPVPRSPTAPVTQGDGEAGSGGESPQAGSGVIAGGGGAGATLFSRPQPQSRGHKRGGVRVLGSKTSHAPAASATAAAGADASAPSPVGAAAPALRHVPAPKRSARAGGSGPGAGSGAAGEPEVSGLLLAASRTPAGADTTVRAAPGLHGAGAGDEGESWPALVIAILIVLLVAAGAQLERRRPQVVL